MREIRTFILRLLIDTDSPQTLRGVLRAVAQDEEHSFNSEQSLRALLHRLSQTDDKPFRTCVDKEKP